MIDLQTGLVVFLHDFFTAVWIGGLLMLTLTTLPALKKTLGHSPESEKVMDAIMKYHSRWVFVSIAGLLITGILLSRSSGDFSGLFNFGGGYNILLSIKHLLVFVMVGLSLIRTFGFRSLAKAPDMKKKKMSLLVMHLNGIVGVFVLLLSGLLSSMS